MKRSKTRFGVIAVIGLVALLALRNTHGAGLLGQAALVQDVPAGSLVVPAKPPLAGPYRFSLKDAQGRPVGWDPCHTIHYVVRVGPGPLNGRQLIDDGLAALARATGLHFQFDGMTDEVPTTAHSRGSGDPLWIGWAEKGETDLYASIAFDVIGLTGTQRLVKGNGNEVFVGGYVLLLPFGRVVPGFAPGESEGNVVLHELGHLAGLDHVDDPNELMHAGVTRQAPNGYGGGDLDGLWALGASRGCQ